MIKQLLSTITGHVMSRDFWTKAPGRLVAFPGKSARAIVLFSTFFILLNVFLIGEILKLFSRLPVVRRVVRKPGSQWYRSGGLLERIFDKLELVRPFKVKRSYLIHIAFQNLLSRRSRSTVTILGMSIGVGIIVYLLSLGYGIEKLVIGQVATLNELKILDVSAGESTTTKLTKTAITKIQSIAGVQKVIPMISVVGRINYKNAKTDVLVYAVTDEFLNISKLNLLNGKLFANDAWYFARNDASGQVAGAEAEITKGRLASPVTGNKLTFNVLPGTDTPAWKECDISSEVVGYTSRLEGGYAGTELWGGEYYPYNPYGRNGYDEGAKRYMGKWIQGKVPLFSRDADNQLIPLLDDQGRQIWETACLERKNVQIVDETPAAQVLGVSTSIDSAENAEETNVEVLAATDETATDSAQVELPAAFAAEVVATNDAGLEQVKLAASDSSQLATTRTGATENMLDYRAQPSGTAVVSSALLKLLNIPVKDALQARFKVSYIIVRSLLPTAQSRVLSRETEYKVVGVIDDAEKQYFYIPFSDMEKLGVSNYSQLKVVLANKDAIKSTRKSVETMGFNTSSAIDTVAQIESFFASLRVILGLIGLIALAVASLGMFNTLTVSLLERTREIGGMKTIGMVSDEIQDLFLAEAMIMGFSGGLGGLLFGYAAGKVSSFIISVFAISKGIGYLELTYIPTYLVVFILMCSFVVGLFTGLYPAYRARKISALNALRYE